MKKNCEGFRCLVNWKKMAYFGSCCENKLKSKEKAEAAICSFGKLAFFQSTQNYSAPLMKRPTIRLLFFPKALLQKSLPNTLLIYFTAAYSHSTAAYSHSSFFSKHSNTKPVLLLLILSTTIFIFQNYKFTTTILRMIHIFQTNAPSLKTNFMFKLFFSSKNLEWFYSF